MDDSPAPRDQQRDVGRSLRGVTPRSALAQLHLPADRDALAILRAQNADRLPTLLPVRLERMQESPFAFFRGAAAVMASDLAARPTTGVSVLICGDAHLSNFGLFASHDRDLVFDVNDFDEAATGPWEWDVLRLVTSAEVLGRELAVAGLRRITESISTTYRRTLARLAGVGALDRYYARIRANQALRKLGETATEARAVTKKAERNTSARALTKLAAQSSDGRWRIVDQPPLTDRLPDFDERDARAVVGGYLASVPPDVAGLVAQFTFQDAVMKVVGVGSVGTRCLLSLFTDPDGEPLFLQVKEASTSVVEAALGRTPVTPHAHRVTAAQRVLQASGDPFLGAFEGPDERTYHVRQYRDMKGGVDPTTLTTTERLGDYGRLCARALARAHAQSGLAATIAAYLGGSSSANAADRAFADFAEAYASINEADHKDLVDKGWGA